MSVMSKKRRKIDRYSKGIAKPNGPSSLMPVKNKKVKKVRKPKVAPKVSLTRLLANQEEMKIQKKIFRKERAQQKPVVELVKRKAQKEAKRQAKQEKMAKKQATAL